MSYNDINPEHYKKGDKEVWEMMISIYGKEAFISFCLLNAFKYRMRIGDKPGQDSESELGKIKWYEDKLKEL